MDDTPDSLAKGPDPDTTRDPAPPRPTSDGDVRPEGETADPRAPREANIDDVEHAPKASEVIPADDVEDGSDSPDAA